MKRFLRRLLKVTAYTAASVLILLAIVVGLFRMFLPRLPEYQEEIKRWASNAIGMQVEFSRMNARWGLSGPELDFYDTELIRPDNRKRAIAASRVSVGVSVASLVFERQFVVDHLAIRDTSIEIRQLERGGWWVQGTTIPEIPQAHSGAPGRLGNIEITGEEIEVRFLQPGDERPRYFRVPRANVRLDERRVAVDAAVRLPGDLGRGIDVVATQLLDVPVEERIWDVIVEADDVLPAGWAELVPAAAGRLLAGSGDVDLSLALNGRGIRSAVAEFDLEDVLLQSRDDFDVEG
ncbi:MAG: hypothetical protein MJA32_09745, partial [Proteobacteria bacterium]|nr:hypothetical protein [Pseudomonadota bacterium]